VDGVETPSMNLGSSVLASTAMRVPSGYGVKGVVADG